MSQVDPMAMAAAGDRGCDIQRAEPGYGLAGVKNPTAGPPHCIDVCPRGGRYAAGSLEEVQHRPLGSQDGRKLSPDQTDGHTGPNSAPFYILPFNGAAAGKRDGISEGGPCQNPA